MSGYVIVRTDHGRTEFVTPPASEHSYTTDIRKAKRWAAREAAQREACGNESVHTVESFLGKITETTTTKGDTP